MRRLERKVMRLNDEVARIAEQRRLLVEELVYHTHLDDDAQRDAAFGDAEDRALAYETSHDRKRFERLVRQADEDLAKLERKRERLVQRLSDL